MTRKITIFTASRSERHLVEPIVEAIKKEPEMHAQLAHLSPADSLSEIHHKTNVALMEQNPDIVLIPCDRREMLACAVACFYHGFPIAHLFAGVYGYGHQDDIARHAISDLSHILLAESEGAREILLRAGEEPWRVHVVGATHFDDMSVDEADVPPLRYDLILINPESGSYLLNRSLAHRAVEAIHQDCYPVFIEPNEDPGREAILDEERVYRTGRPTTIGSLPRNRFLGLLKGAHQFISNSSATIYEAPYFGVPVVNPGIRNRERMAYTGPTDGHASERVAKALRYVEIDRKLLTKRVRNFL